MKTKNNFYNVTYTVAQSGFIFGEGHMKIRRGEQFGADIALLQITLRGIFFLGGGGGLQPPIPPPGFTTVFLDINN